MLDNREKVLIRKIATKYLDQMEPLTIGDVTEIRILETILLKLHISQGCLRKFRNKAFLEL